MVKQALSAKRRRQRSIAVAGEVKLLIKTWRGDTPEMEGGDNGNKKRGDAGAEDGGRQRSVEEGKGGKGEGETNHRREGTPGLQLAGQAVRCGVGKGRTRRKLEGK